MQRLGTHGQFQLHQLRICCTKKGRLERARQRKGVLGRDEGIDQRDDVLHFGRIGQQLLLRHLAADTIRGQGLLHDQQAVVFARHDEDVLRLHACLQALSQPRCGLLAFAGGDFFFGIGLGRGQAVAPGGVGIGCGAGGFFRAFDYGQGQHATCCVGGGGVRAKVAEMPLRLCCQHRGIDGLQHGRSIAAGMVATENGALHAVLHKVARRAKHGRVGAAKAVNALLGVAHNEYAGRLPGAGIAGQPGVQGLPLQGGGVLKFINQHVADLGVQPFLQPAAQAGVLQKRACGVFHIGHINPAVLPLDGGITAAQQARQAHHALLMHPACVLDVGLQHVLHGGLRGAYVLQMRYFVAEFAWLAFLRHQGIVNAAPILGGDGLFQRGAECLEAGGRGRA